MKQIRRIKSHSRTGHQKLSFLDAKLQLVPGDLVSSVIRIANSHVRTDMLVISSSYHTEELNQIWYYVPRMLHAASIVFLQDPNDSEGYFEQLGRLEIERIVKRRTQGPNSSSGIIVFRISPKIVFGKLAPLEHRGVEIQVEFVGAFRDHAVDSASCDAAAAEFRAYQ